MWGKYDCGGFWEIGEASVARMISREVLENRQQARLRQAFWEKPAIWETIAATGR